jgi:hypothetical protein
MRLNNLNNINDFDLELLAEQVEPLLTYESVESESPAHIFTSYVLERETQEDLDSMKCKSVNLCRPAGGLAVGLAFSLRRHLGLVHPRDCIGYIGSLNSVFGTYYNILGPLLVGSHAFINEHSNCDFEALKQSISVSKMTTLIISSETIRK